MCTQQLQEEPHHQAKPYNQKIWDRRTWCTLGGMKMRTVTHHFNILTGKNGITVCHCRETECIVSAKEFNLTYTSALQKWYEIWIQAVRHHYPLRWSSHRQIEVQHEWGKLGPNSIHSIYIVVRGYIYCYSTTLRHGLIQLHEIIHSCVVSARAGVQYICSILICFPEGQSQELSSVRGKGWAQTGHSARWSCDCVQTSEAKPGMTRLLPHLHRPLKGLTARLGI